MRLSLCWLIVGVGCLHPGRPRSTPPVPLGEIVAAVESSRDGFCDARHVMIRRLTRFVWSGAGPIELFLEGATTWEALGAGPVFSRVVEFEVLHMAHGAPPPERAEALGHGVFGLREGDIQLVAFGYDEDRSGIATYLHLHHASRGPGRLGDFSTDELQAAFEAACGS